LLKCDTKHYSITKFSLIIITKDVMGGVMMGKTDLIEDFVSILNLTLPHRILSVFSIV
jgi:hypothetical protein